MLRANDSAKTKHSSWTRTTNSAAIDPLFHATQITNEAGEPDYSFYWSGTTHANSSTNPGGAGAYVGFGRALGSLNEQWQDVHGAGCQRSDPKTGNPDDYPEGFGPQGDAIRIYNYVRLVRDADDATGVEPSENTRSKKFELIQNSPNPFNPTTTISFNLPVASQVSLKIYNLQGREVVALVNGQLSAGAHAVEWQGHDLANGVYFYTLQSSVFSETKRMILLK